MTLSPITAELAELAEAYELEHGQKPTEQALRIAEHILKVGKMLTELGQKDAVNGEKAYTADVFQKLVVKAFRIKPDEDHETVQAVANLWRLCYMDGYTAIRKPE